MAAFRRRCGFGEKRFRLGPIGFLDSRTHSHVDEAFLLRQAASKLAAIPDSNRVVQNRWHFHITQLPRIPMKCHLSVSPMGAQIPASCVYACLKTWIQPFTEKPRLVRCWIESNGMTGLVVAVAQNVDTEAVLMQGFANREALLTTISYRKAFIAGEDQLCGQRDKPQEEADELCRTLEENENPSRTASEMADVLYHSMVLLAQKEVTQDAEHRTKKYIAIVSWLKMAGLK